MSQFVSMDGPNVSPRMRIAQLGPNPATTLEQARIAASDEQPPAEVSVDVRFLESTPTYALALERRELISGKLTASAREGFEVVIYRSAFSRNPISFHLSRQISPEFSGEQRNSDEPSTQRIGFDLFLVPRALLLRDKSVDDARLHTAVQRVLEFSHGGKPTSVGPR